MGDSLITIVAIFLAAILMFVFPLMTLAERTDDISSLAVQTATKEFVDGVRTVSYTHLDSDYLSQIAEHKVPRACDSIWIMYAGKSIRDVYNRQIYDIWSNSSNCHIPSRTKKDA